MTYDIRAEDRTKNSVIELVSFRTGPESYIHTSTFSKEITFEDGDTATTFQPFPFDRGDRKISNAFEDDSVRIEVPLNHPICSHYRALPTNYDVSVVIRRGFVSDNGTPYNGPIEENYPILVIGWVGDVTTDPEAGTATISLVTYGDTLAAPSLTRNYQHSCPLMLYGPKCGAARLSTEINHSGYEAAYLKVISGWNGDVNLSAYIGGILTFKNDDMPNEFRMISKATSDKIHFVGSMLNLGIAPTVEVAIGCSHTLDGCRTLHKNSRRYGGFPWMPTENPVNKSVR